MSQTAYKKITLQDVLSQASYVLVVKKTEPFEEYENISIGDDPLKHPPFKKRKFNFVVVDRLDALHNGPKIGDAITAVNAETYADLEMHKLYYLEGRSKSRLANSYDTEANFNQENELILFISFFSNNEYLFSGFESTSRTEEIKNILKNFPPNTNIIQVKRDNTIKPKPPKK